MGVRFTADLVPADAFVASCGCPDADARAERFTTFDEAHEAAEVANLGRRAALPGCAMPEVCPDYPLYARELHEDGAPAVELHSANAVRLLELLGLAFTADQPAVGFGTGALQVLAVDAYGQLDPQAFLGRVLLAEALTPADAGAEPLLEGRHYRGGRSAGHLQYRLRELRDLAAWCSARGRLVAWG